MQVSAASKAQSVNIVQNEISLKNLFDEIKKQTGYNFLWSAKKIKNTTLVRGDFKRTSLKAVLNKAFEELPLAYTIENETILVFEKTPAFYIGTINVQPPTVVVGKVTDQAGKPIGGVTIRAKGSEQFASTDKDGKFSIPMPESSKILIFSYLGLETREIEVKGRTTLNVVLREKTADLKEVTIINNGFQNIDIQKSTGAVTSLKLEDIYVEGFTSVDKMLEGKVPGLTFMQNTGQVGAAPKLRIRGTSTILGSQEPLWVVDGIIVEDPVKVDPAQINDLDFVNLLGNAIAGVNPNDIEQIDVLKDAAATALYGVRAANGVIVITTKRGKAGAASINYNLTSTFSTRPHYSDKSIFLMNSMERVDVSREMVDRKREYIGASSGVSYEGATMDYYSGKIDYATYQNLVNRYETINTDWFDAVTRDVFSTNQTLSATGGSENIKYYASLGYNNELGVIKGEGNKRYTGNLKMDLNYKRFTGQFSFMGNLNRRNYNPQELNILDYAYNTSRALPLYNTDGSLLFYNQGSSLTATDNASYGFNVLNEMANSETTIKGNSITARANLNYRITDAWKLSAIFSSTTDNTRTETWYDQSTYRMLTLRGNGTNTVTLAPFGGELQESLTTHDAYTTRLQTDYSKLFGQSNKHFINVTLGGELSSNKYYTTAQNRRGYYPYRGKTFAEIDLLTYTRYRDIWVKPNSGIDIEDKLTNLMGGYVTGTYGYDDRFIFTATTRTDASNAFGTRSNEKLLPVWSVSGLWNAHKDILKNVKWIDMMAVRGSYGQQGNMIDNQTPELIITKGPLESNYGEFASTVSYFPNPNLKWEKTASYNTTLDFALFGNKLRGAVSVYYKKTDNAFMTKTISSINGTGSYVVNRGVLENKGVEVSLSFTPINNSLGGGKKGFVWRFDPQLGQVVNTLISKAINNKNNVLIDEVNYSNYLDGSVVLAGTPLNTFYSYRFAGLSPLDGSPTFYDTDVSNQEKYQKMDKQSITLAVLEKSGNRVPTIQGGLSNYFGYGNFGLSFNLSYSLGNKVRLLKIASDYGTNLPLPYQNLRAEYNNRWRAPGDEAFTNIPALRVTNPSSPWWELDQSIPRNSIGSNVYDMYDNSNLRVVSGDFLKLTSMSFRYTLDKDLCEKLKLKGAYLSLSGTNLFTIANKEMRGQDPVQSGSSAGVNLSLRPTYSLNFNLTF